jgi:hypothetical protein
MRGADLLATMAEQPGVSRSVRWTLSS